MKLKGSARDFSRLDGIDQLGESHNLQDIPTWYYDFRRFDFPLTAAELDAEFGKNIRLFDVSQATGGNRQTNAETGSGVNEAFLALSAGIVAMGEGESFSVYGISSDAATLGVTNPLTIESRTGVNGDCYCGSAFIREGLDAPTAHATFWWGGPTWRFIEKFFQAYRLQISVNRRFQMVDESLFDVGMLQIPPEFGGAGDSTIQPMPFIRAVNDNLQTKGVDQLFMPSNVRINSDSQSESTSIPPPLVPVTYGHPRIQGASNRIYCFNTPLLFVPGIRFDVEFINNEDKSVYTALTNTSTASCLRPIAGQEGDFGAGEAGFGNNAATHCVIPGGSVSLGAVFKGYGMQPSAAAEYMMGHLGGSMHQQMYREVMGSLGLGNLMQSGHMDESVRSRLAGWLKKEI